MSTLLTIAAHPDDASLFWGGTLARLVDEGWQAVSVTVDDGRGAPHSFEMDADTLADTRHRELAWESQRLGATMAHLQLQGVKTTESRDRCHAELVRLILEHRPERVIIHNLNDSHATHVMVAKLSLRALVAAHVADAGYALPEVWQADGWEPVHYPDLRIDVTRYMNIKMPAVAMHGSQVFDTPYLMGAWGLALYRAGFAASHEVTDPGVLFAEAFRRIAPENLAAVSADNDPEA
ncbi:MAG: PIG-L family deacetylase [Armatimonadetes bacterium]|nr:PIG-L family deacetylase [Armatimonadota bacterium]